MDTLINVAALALYAFWLLVYWSGGESLLKSLRETQSAPDRAVLLLLTVDNLTLLLIAVFAVFQTAETFLSPPIRVIGLVLEVAGIAGMFYSRSILGKFWTAQTTLQEGHRVVDTSVYGVVRHPIYTAALLMLIGLTLVLSTPVGIVVGLLALMGYFAKTALEDDYLGKNLPGYADYQQRVRFRLIPGIW